MAPLIALCVGLPIGLAVVALALRGRRAERARSQAPTPGPSGRVSLGGVPSLDALADNPRAADALAGRVRSVYVMSLPALTAGAQEGNDVLGESALFIVDIEGAVHQPSGFRDPQAVELIGRQLADDLGVAFDMR